jgi:hypothetical protein
MSKHYSDRLIVVEYYYLGETAIGRVLKIVKKEICP